MNKPIVLFLFAMLAFPCLVYAEIETDLRFKLGNAAGLDGIEFENAVGSGPDKRGTNAQAEVVMSPRPDSRTSFVIGIGLFHRQHSGEINNLSVPIDVEYAVTGMSIAPGARLRISDALSFEMKFELGLSSAGHVTLKSPGIDWNAARKGNYLSTSLIAGAYYVFESSSIRVGVEVGMQEVNGHFEIMSNGGGWSPGNLTGEGGIGNIVFGFQF
jgi:hypothetical protein